MSQIDSSPTCPRCDGDRLRREARRIPSRIDGMHTTGGWWVCLDCACCFDGVTDHDDGILPWWVQKRGAGMAARGELPEMMTEEDTK